MVYDFCTACKARADRCLLPDSHRAQNRVVWCVDFLLGGKQGTRIRKQMKPGVTKKDAEKFEHITIADFERGTFIPSDKSKTKVSEILDQYYNEHLLPNVRDKRATTTHYIRTLKRLVGHISIGSLTLQQLAETRSIYQDEAEIANASVNRCFTHLKAALNYALERDYIQKNPAQFLRALPVMETVARFYTMEETERLYCLVKDDRLLKRMNAILHTGIRPINLDDLTWPRVDMHNRVIQITTYKGRRPHTYPVPIDDILFKDLQERYKMTNGKGLVYDSSNLRKLSYEAIEASGINDGRTYEERLTIYGLKHTYASNLLMNGASLFDVAKLLGHTDTKMVVKHYGFLTIEHLRLAQSKSHTPALTPQLQVI